MKFKLKTRKAASKRVKIKKKKLYHKCAFKSHLLKNKSNKRLRRLSKVNVVNKTDSAVFFRMLPYLN